MNVYMLQNTDTGLFYKRRGGWVEKSKGAIWTTKSGPNSARGNYWAGAHGKNIIVRTFTLVDEE